MKKLLSKENNFYKANLHCHSTFSDGKRTPEELKHDYMERGYSIIAYTDHDILISHRELNDENFLALNGYEIGISEPGSERTYAKTCHLCYIALDENNLTQLFYHTKKYLFGNALKYRHLIKYDESTLDFERQYNPECINKMIKAGRNSGFFVTYNHPGWSLESFGEYTRYRGMNAMEIYNHSCVYSGHPDYNEKAYEDILRGGERIYCIAADDNHNQNDAYGGFTFINAEKLEYSAVAKALSDGKFYASQAPEIYELWYEDGKIGIECSDCETIILNTARRRTAVARRGDSPLTSAVFDVFELDGYVRITVTDSKGKHANTSAYFVDELNK